LVFVKALTNEHAESNLLISTATGRQISFLLVSRGEGPNSTKVDFLLRYQPSGGFLVEPYAVPFALVSQTASVSKTPVPLPVSSTLATGISAPVSGHTDSDSLDSLLERQKQAPLPVL
jgi:hypothetical protein